MSPIRPFLRSAGVTEAQWRVLRVLSDEGQIDASRLADAALLYPPSVTRILRELERRTLIERHSDAKDGRRSLLALSAEGAELVKRTADHTLAVLDLFDDRFGAERLARLRRELADFAVAIADLVGDDPIV